MLHLLQSIRQLLQTVSRKLSRKWLHLRMRGRPAVEVLAAERRLRGKDQLKWLQRSDIVVVSFGKSGRTWLRVMISHLFRVMYALPENALLSFDNFHRLNSAVPRIFFTHDNYIKDYTGDADSKRPFYHKRVVLLARDPRDVAVSQFFQWKFRLKPGKVAINNYPERGSDISLFDFVSGDTGAGMAAICDYLNLWAQESGQLENFYLLRYEDLRREPHAQLSALLEFMQVDASPEHIDAAVEYSSVENMKKMESSKKFQLAGARMLPGDKKNPDSYKVRRAKVGGYRDYFNDGEIEAIDSQLAASLDPVFGYSAVLDKS
ncbi:MAG: sulfotransferase domain-containing protein [Gammaproteobacteria bacterium]|nr:sulfotransferase domain-containing protein [Gammaproteobacteria bacterium]